MRGIPALLYRFYRAVIVFSVVFACSFAFSQDASTGAIRGTVIDASGSRVAGASIAFVNSATGFRYAVTSDSAGEFAFDLLPPGDYSGRAIASGMSPQLSSGLHVDIGAITQVEFKLEVAGAKESITVSGTPPLVEAQPNAVSALIDQR